MPPALCRSLVGRDGQLAALVAALEGARAGAGDTVVLVGEAGVGKSRLAQEAAREARERGMCVLRGRAVESATPVPFRPLAEALLTHFRGTGPPDLPELAPFRPILARLVPEWRTGEPGADDSAVFLAEALLRLLRALAADRGCLVVLEDLHWADPETIAVVTYLADQVRSEPLACIVTVSTEEPGAALAMARTLAARRDATVLDLTRLEPAQVQDMVRACLDTEVPGEVAALVGEWSDGLPFLVEELVSAALARQGRGPVTQDALEPVVPPTFADTVRRRLRAIGRDGQDVLVAGAVLGRRFEPELVARTTGLPSRRVLNALRAALDVQLVVPATDAPTAFRFRHALTRAAVRDAALPAERAALSRRALAAVEEMHPGLPSGWCELAAELAENAGDHERAAELLLRAALRAADAGALATAGRALERARRHSPASSTLAADIDAAHAHVLSLAGEVDRALELGMRALRAFSLRGTPPARCGDLRLLLARTAVAAGRWPDATGHLDQARQLLGSVGDQAGLAAVDALAAHVALAQDRSRTALSLATAALDVAETAGAPDVACEALEVIGRCHRSRDLAAARTAFERSLAVAEARGSTLWAIRSSLQLAAIDLLATGPVDRLVDARDRALQAGALATAAGADLQIAWWNEHRFDPPAMLDAAARCERTARRLRLGSLLAMALVAQATARAQQGDEAGVEAALAEARQVGGEDPDVAAAAWGHARTTSDLVRDDPLTAAAHLDTAMSFLRRSPAATPMPMRGLWALLRTVHGTDGDAARAEVRASGTALHAVVDGYLALADAVAAGRRGHAARAAAAFARGDAVFAPFDWYRHLMRRHVAPSALQDGWGEPVAWLREGLAYFEAHGHVPIAAACRSLLRTAGVPVPRHTHGRDRLPAALRSLGVTPREAEVLALLAQGESTRSIATRLYLSPKTVERHVASLVTKTGTGTRAKLVAFAAARRE